MRTMIQTDRARCVGCNRCIRVCPIEIANITFLDDDGNIKVKIDPEKCISCGACLSACRHGARYYEDDSERFFDDLAHGEQITLMVAPSVRTNFPEWPRLLALFRQLGVQTLFDVSLGADLCIWAHLRYIEREQPKSMISQPCASIVAYCEMYRPELLSSLSPVHSPMGCSAILLTKYQNTKGRIAALSPCASKGQEFESIGMVDYSITFKKLQAYLDEHNILLPEELSSFDYQESALGRMFPMPGGLKQNIEHFTGKSIRVDRAEGAGIYEKLDEYSVTDPELLPQIFDVLNCPEGCNKGPGCIQHMNDFGIQSVMADSERAALETYDHEAYAALYALFDEKYDPDAFLRTYEARNASPEVTEEQIQQAFLQMDKDTEQKQTFDCSACGSTNCRNMAKRIALGLNIPINCIVKARDDMAYEHRKNADLYRRNAGYLQLVNDIADGLVSTDDDEFARVVEHSLDALCSTLKASNAFIWKRLLHKDGSIYYMRTYGWDDNISKQKIILEHKDLHTLFSTLERGDTYFRYINEMDPADQKLFPDKRAVSVLDVPIFIQGEFWGFIAVHDDEKTVYDEEEIHVVASIGILIVSSLVEKEGAEMLRKTRETALEATRAKSDFLSRMSHEMRTPMNAIIGMTQIAENSEDVSRLKHCLDTINTSSTHLLGLINDVLDMSKIEAGKFDLDIGQFNLEKMLMKISNIILDKTEQKNQVLRIVIGKGVHSHYIGDELRLSQVITNLLGNAVKFTPDLGKIVLRVDALESHENIDLLRYSVSDTGIGMTEEQVGRLFTAFEQADASITQRFGGTGLGLAISKNIVEKMGGRIWVESEMDVGSTFQFEVELKRSASTPPTVILGGINPEELNILAVDSDADIREQFKHILDQFGMQSQTAGTNEELFEQIKIAKERKRPFDVVFLDYDMPDSDAISTLLALSGVLDRNTVVIMTSFVEWNEIEPRVSAAGVRRFIAKPLFPSTVLDAINEVVNNATQTITRPSPTLATSDFSNVMLLLAEDIQINQEVFIALLQDTGITIETADNGRIAVEMFEQNPDRYDMIVMDIQMPEMNGHEATRAIRALPIERAQEIPIIAMTANAFKEDIEQCLESGMNDHLSKPIDLKALINRIAHYTT